MLKVYFTIINKQGEEVEVITRTEEGTPEKVGQFACDYANEYLEQFDDIETVKWEVVKPLNGGHVSKDPSSNGWT